MMSGNVANSSWGVVGNDGKKLKKKRSFLNGFCAPGRVRQVNELSVKEMRPTKKYPK